MPIDKNPSLQVPFFPLSLSIFESVTIITMLLGGLRWKIFRAINLQSEPGLYSHFTPAMCFVFCVSIFFNRWPVDHVVLRVFRFCLWLVICIGRRITFLLTREASEKTNPVRLRVTEASYRWLAKHFSLICFCLMSWDAKVHFLGQDEIDTPAYQIYDG